MDLFKSNTTTGVKYFKSYTGHMSQTKNLQAMKNCGHQHTESE